MSGGLLAAVLGAGLGMAVVLIARGLRRRPPDLARAVAPREERWRRAQFDLVRDLPQDLGPIQRFLARPGLRLLEMLGLTDRGLLRERLIVLDKSIERHAYEKMAGGLTGLLLPLLLAAVLAADGTSIPALPVLLGAMLAGVGGFLYPDLPLADQVERRQQAFRHALSTYLDLVTIILAGGGGTESALRGAAEAGDGWVFAEVRAALRRGELTGRTPWDMFEELGQRYGIDELRELAASVSLAGGQGARVRQSLVSKSEALRAQQSADLEAKAESNTEKMIVPVTIMVLGLMIFIGRGAIDAIQAGTPGGGSSSPTSTQQTGANP